MSNLSKRQKMSENHVAADSLTPQQIESQTKIPCPPRLHRSKAAPKKKKTAAKKKQPLQKPVESDQVPDFLEGEMDSEMGEQEEQETHSCQEYLIKVIITHDELN